MTTESVWLIVASLGVVQALFLACYLVFQKQGNLAANQYLALLLFAISLRIGKSIFHYYLTLPDWQRNLGLTGFLIAGPALFLYIRSYSTIQSSVQKSLLHFLPAALWVVLVAYIPNRYDLVSYVIFSLLMVHFLLYIGFAHISRLQLNAASLTPDFHNWLKYLSIGVTAIWLYYALVFTRVIPFYLGGAILYSTLICAFAWIVLNKSILFTQVGKVKYAGSQLTEAQMTNRFSEIDNWLKTEKAFLTPKYGLKDLAEKFAVSSREMSQIINSNTGMNVSEYINDLRINNAKDMLADPQYAKAKILAVAYDCGFNNLTSFNQKFKAKLGVTPSDFRKQSVSKLPPLQ